MALPTLTRYQKTEAPPELADWRRDPRLGDLARKRDDLIRQASKLAADVAAGESRLAAAEADVEPAEVANLTGKLDAKGLERVRETARKARADLADARAKAEGSSTELRKVGSALAIVTDEAKIAARHELAGLYRLALGRLDVALAAAVEANDAVFAIWDWARGQFGPMPERSPRGITHPSCGGLIRASWIELMRPDGVEARAEGMAGMPTRYAQWHRDTEADGWVAGGSETPIAVAPSPRLPPGSRRLTFQGEEPALRRFTPDVEHPDQGSDEAEEARLGLQNWSKS
jgi:hypothetical protein